MQEVTILPAASNRPGHNSEACRITLRRQVLDWRDRWSLEIEMKLARLCRDKAGAIAPWVAQLWTYELAAARTGFTEYPALPEMMEEARKLADTIITEARDELRGIVAHHLELEAKIGNSDLKRDLGPDQLLAIGRGVAPLAAAAALLAALPGLASTTTVTMFGLITTSTVSVPILTAGAAGVAALGYFGVINVSGLRAQQERTLIESIEAEIEARLLATGTSKEPSLLAQVQKGLASAASDLLETLT